VPSPPGRFVRPFEGFFASERKGLTVENNLMTSVQQAELQGKVWRVVEDFRQQHGLGWLSMFSFLVSFAWGYAKRERLSAEEIDSRIRTLCMANELAFQRATSPALPFDKGQP
jgi:hypothetical protein